MSQAGWIVVGIAGLWLVMQARKTAVIIDSTNRVTGGVAGVIDDVRNVTTGIGGVIDDIRNITSTVGGVIDDIRNLSGSSSSSTRSTDFGSFF